MNQRHTMFVLLLIAAIDYMGIALVYPLFSSMLFDNQFPLVPFETSYENRGLFLGILLSLMPIAQFFSAPFWGTLSDGKGRKPTLLLSTTFGILGYALGIVAVYHSHLWLLFFSRLLIGVGAGNTAIVQAAIADISQPHEKTARFGLYSMACGIGFTFGPTLGGALAFSGYTTPFFAGLALIILNLCAIFFFFKETYPLRKKIKIDWKVSFILLKKACQFKGLRVIFWTLFLHSFGWSYFFEFISVYLIEAHHFSPLNLGIFYSVCGGVYALGTGVLLRPLANRLASESLFFWGNLLSGCSILGLFFFPSFFLLWVFAILLSYFVSFCFPAVESFVSNKADVTIQGEALGIVTALNAAALGLAPLLSGSMIGSHPALPILIGGPTMIAAAAILFFFFGKDALFKKNL